MSSDSKNNEAGEAAADARVVEERGAEKKQEAMLLFHMFCNVTGICVLLQARNILVTRQVKGDAASMAKRLSYMSAAVGVLELLVNPIAGQLSDRLGRRPFLLFGPACNMVNKLLVSACPDSPLVLAWERVVNGAVWNHGSIVRTDKA